MKLSQIKPSHLTTALTEQADGLSISCIQQWVDMEKILKKEPEINLDSIFVACFIQKNKLEH